MLKSTAVALIAGSLTTVAAVEAYDILDRAAPDAAAIVADANLRSIYTEAVSQSLSSGSSVEQVLPAVLDGYQTEGVRYSLSSSGDVVAETDWSCRVGSFNGVRLTIIDC